MTEEERKAHRAKEEALAAALGVQSVSLGTVAFRPEQPHAPKPFVRGQKINIQNAPSSLEQSVAEWNRTKWIDGR